MIFGILFWSCVLLVIYTYFGYPALLAIIARPSPPIPNLADDQLPTVTLLIAAYDEEQSIAGKLANSLKLDYPRHLLEIIVAADGSSDQTVAIVESFCKQGIKLSYSPERKGKMAAINRAISTATGEIVVFSDANNIYAEDAIRKLVLRFVDPQVAAVTGSKHIVKRTTQLGNSESLYWKYESFIREKESILGCCTGVCGEIFSIRRALFEQPSQRVINDDFVMAMSLIGKGFQIAYAKDACSYEQVSATSAEENIRRARIIAGRYQALLMARQWLPFNRPLLLWQIFSHKILRAFVPLAMLGALATNLLSLAFPIDHEVSLPLLALAWPYALWVLCIQLVFYGLAFWGERITKQETRLPVWLYLPTFLVNSNLAALKGLVQFFTGQQTALWKKARRESFDLADMEQAVKQQQSPGENAG